MALVSFEMCLFYSELDDVFLWKITGFAFYHLAMNLIVAKKKLARIQSSLHTYFIISNKTPNGPFKKFKCVRSNVS